MGLMDGRVALVTGAARGQGRAHCRRLAMDGASIIALDVCQPVPNVKYAASTQEDLLETARMVESLGCAVVSRVADVRDGASLDSVVNEGVERLGGLDVVVANAGICTWSRFWEMSEEQWQTMIDINLTGVWKTFKAAAPAMIEQGRGGSMIAVSSVAGLKGLPAQAHYTAAKHGLVGLVKSAAIELAEFGIRVNSIHPWGVDTPMADDPDVGVFLERHPQYAGSFGSLLADPMAQPEDIAEAVLWLASDLSRMVTGVQLPIDAGATTV